ncbi:Tetratricopeptide [Pleurostoma richardsiae]|uniref:Tetratricopeptide n=1 Tax=Pleurostoma richardsiae TaxID=41990 RepID=A0AA38RU94_9PEZI|nr:Tetratricopeptide [Pleurostoma richardsiae]
MSGTKAALKAIGEAVRAQKFDDAIQQAQDFLQKEQKNYQAHIFLAFALDKKSKLDEAQQAYEAARRLRPTEPSAWQGLIKLFERQGPKKLGQYQDAALHLAEIYRDTNDIHKCQEVVDKFIDFARIQGERLQYAEALELILPESPIYLTLEGRVPHPARTYETVAQILETEEKKRINTLIGERRTRIGARIGDVTVEVKREVLGQSKLGHIYEQLINWSNDDDVRRQYEERLLQFRHDRLMVFPPGQEKSQELEMVQKLADGMVIIKHPFKLAWDIAIDWKDFKSIKEWDVNVLREYCTFFPDSDLCRVVTGFLTSEISPFPKPVDEPSPSAANGAAEDESEDDEEGGAPTSVIPLTDEDRLIMMTEGITTADSLLAYRLMGEYYQYLQEHESNVELMRKALDLLNGERTKTGLKFNNTEDAFQLYLGTALVFYQSPRNHQEAKTLFDQVLERDPASTPALIGVGLIYEEEEEYEDAISFLSRALERAPDNLRVRTEAAWVKALKGDYSNCKEELEACIPDIAAKGPSSKELLAETQYRLGICIWNLDTSKAARKDRHGAYAYFLDALRNNLNLAPAYSSLGVYYADYASDTKRARRCFHKAVELSPSEVEAAERLARSFAEDSDWDRVELVAQRVVDSGKVKPPPGSKRKGISWPFAALGVAELNKQDFYKAIVSFQSALRMSPEDYHAWVGLGESYYSSGRYISATKAILNAQRLEEEAGADKFGDTWFTKFLLANVKRELGEYDDAVALYQDVINGRPDEEGVAIALMQTLIDSALDCIEKGLFGKSVGLATESLIFATKSPENIRITFNFWKVIADSCSIFSSVQSRVTEFPTKLIRRLLSPDDSTPGYDLFKETDGVGTGVIFAQGLFADDEKVGVDLTRSLHAAILANKRAIEACSHDIHAQAVAYYNLGWTEHRAHTCLPAAMRKKASRYLKTAVKCFKRAIELEAGNSEFWNALGVVTSEINPAVSQHSFVRSLYVNERGVHVWTNLGTLALLQNDLQLANEAFTRAQSTDPDYAHAWLGQAFVALMYGDAKEARGLFTHAMDISEASSFITRQQYSVSVFDYVLSAPPNLPITSLLQPIFALGQLRALRPQDPAYGHLMTLFQERVNDSPRAVQTLEHICETLEADYEATESAESLKRFALAKTDLARSYLASGSYDQAVECGEMALQLSSDESDNELSAEERKRARLSAHLTVGLAHYYSDNPDEAVTYFKAALDESDQNPDAVCVLAQVLWATGTEEARDEARTVLFQVVEKQPDHVQSVLLLGVIALLDDDDETLEAVISEMQGLRTNNKVIPVEQSQIGDILQAVAALSGDDNETEVRAQAQADIMLHPYLPHGWSNLVGVSEVDDEFPGEMAVKVASRAIPPRGQLDAESLARACAGTGRPADAQIGIFVAPWVRDGWDALADAV